MKLFKRNNEKGFSIVELIVVIAIISIVTAIAIPIYSNYQVRTKVSSVDIVAQTYINEITHYTYEQGKFPAEDSDLWGCVEVNRDNLLRVCKERMDDKDAVIKVYIEPTLAPDITDPYYQYDLTLTE